MAWAPEDFRTFRPRPNGLAAAVLTRKESKMLVLGRKKQQTFKLIVPPTAHNVEIEVTLA